MSRRAPRRPTPKPRAEPVTPFVDPPAPRPIPGRTLALVAAVLLLGHYGVAAWSLLRENPTIDEVNHLPAGITYWQTGSFRVYRHNPPLVKLVAALPIAGTRMEPTYDSPAWKAEPVAQSAFGQGFLRLHARDYFELFAASRLMMPLFSVFGGLIVFLWSRGLWGDRGGLLSLTLWCICPNILAHARLITSDAAAASIGVAATFAFVAYLKSPTWRRAAIAGLLLGFAQLTKFSLLLLLGLWPLLWSIQAAAEFDRKRFLARLGRATLHAIAILALCVLVIDVGYGFEGVGRRLGSFNFASRSFLTRPGRTPMVSENYLLTLSWKHRVNRFRGTWMAALPSPLPSHYLLGFDEQKIEADGLPRIWSDPDETDPDAVDGYPVYLDGVLRDTGWRDYYARCLLYKVPEGTLFLVGLAIVAAAGWRRARAGVADESALVLSPLLVLGAMSFLTDINLGLRYVLPLFPYVFIAAGRLAPWAAGFAGPTRRVVAALVLAPLACSILASALMAPSFLAYFNAASGGPDRMPPRLIDSNLDWGQDLVGLRRWLRENREAGPIGLAYFGQITPQVFEARGEGFAWFLPPVTPGRLRPLDDRINTSRYAGPAASLRPGLYAVSASLVQGLRWRVYDPSPRVWAGIWRAEKDAFGYFRRLKPFHRIGHSILLYRVTEADAARINRLFGGR